MKIKRAISPSLLLLASMLWGFAFAAQDKAGDIGPFALGAARSILATVFLFLVLIAFEPLRGGGSVFRKKMLGFNRRELIGGAICGVVLASASALQQIGINKGTDGGKAAFITALYVVLVPVYQLAMKKRAPFNVWIGVALSAIGFYLLCINGGFTVQPSDLFIVGCSLLFPLQILAIDGFSEGSDGIRTSFVQFFVASVINTAVSLIFEAPAKEAEAILGNPLPVLYLGIVSSGIAYTLQILGQKGTPPAPASIILSLESVFGVLGVAIFVGSTLSVREYIGCAVVLAAVIVAQLEFKSKKKEDPDGLPPA